MKDLKSKGEPQNKKDVKEQIVLAEVRTVWLFDHGKQARKIEWWKWIWCIEFVASLPSFHSEEHWTSEGMVAGSIPATEPILGV